MSRYRVWFIQKSVSRSFVGCCFHDRSMGQQQSFRSYASSSSFASVNGIPTCASSVRVSVWDMSFQRGDGVFEVLRVPPGGGKKPRGLNLHLDRLERSAHAIQLELPPRTSIEEWLQHAASESNQGGILRLMVTRGGGMAGCGHHLTDLDAVPTTFILWQPMPPTPTQVRLLPKCAPWHPAGFQGKEEWNAIKWLSYGPNVHSTRIAQRHGYDDMLLLARGHGVDDDTGDDDDMNRVVLDGPNWAIAWMNREGVFCTPCWKSLGLLQSVTCELAMQACRRLDIPTHQGTFRLSQLFDNATCLYMMSTTRDLLPVVSLGKVEMPQGNEETRRQLICTINDIVEETP